MQDCGANEPTTPRASRRGRKSGRARPPEPSAFGLGTRLHVRAAKAGYCDDVFDAVVEAVTHARVPSPAWFEQARRNAQARQSFLEEFGALDSRQIAQLAGSQAVNRRATAHRWQTKGKIFAVVHHGRIMYPAFQFDPETGRPKPTIAEVLSALPSAMTGWTLALWWATPMDWLDWDRPVDRLDVAPAKVIGAARAEEADWLQAAPA